MNSSRRTFVLFNHDKKTVTVLAPRKPSLEKALDETITKAKRFVARASGAGRNA